MLLATWNMAVGIMAVKNSLKEQKRFKLLKLGSGKFLLDLNEIIKNLEPPFAFEIAIKHLGRDIGYYLAVPAGKMKGLNLKDAKAAHDYNIFHQGGSHTGVFLKGILSLKDLNLANIDFSRINEIGEGAVVQLLFKEKGKANFRILVSAPTPYRVQEILFAMKPAFSDFKMVESKDKDFVRRVTYREFDDRELIEWRSI